MYLTHYILDTSLTLSLPQPLLADADIPRLGFYYCPRSSAFVASDSPKLPSPLCNYVRDPHPRSINSLRIRITWSK
jgi:hypothetical protein